MPPLILLTHLLLTAAVVGLSLRLPPRSPAARCLGGFLLAAVALGLAAERRGDWAWDAMGAAWSDAVFFTNLSLEGVAALIVVLWRSATGRRAVVRAVFLSAAALGATGWSYAWLFAPVPPGLNGRADATGYCGQTSNDSCSAAAAVMLLHHYGIPATEAEMAVACLTRAGHGTPSLGLYRGLSVYARRSGMRPQLVRLAGPAEFSRLTGPAIIRVGIPHTASPPVAERMEQYGWSKGNYHSVLVTAGDPGGTWIDVSDPSYKRERWPTRDLEWLWDGRALILRPDGR